jgi:hypothetical protein
MSGSSLADISHLKFASSVRGNHHKHSVSQVCSGTRLSQLENQKAIADMLKSA